MVKALCLGARAVGLGRSFLYAESAYGTEGVKKGVQCKCDLTLKSSIGNSGGRLRQIRADNAAVLSDEIETTMRLNGRHVVGLAHRLLCQRPAAGARAPASHQQLITCSLHRVRRATPFSFSRPHQSCPHYAGPRHPQHHLSHSRSHPHYNAAPARSTTYYPCSPKTLRTWRPRSAARGGPWGW